MSFISKSQMSISTKVTWIITAHCLIFDANHNTETSKVYHAVANLPDALALKLEHSVT